MAEAGEAAIPLATLIACNPAFRSQHFYSRVFFCRGGTSSTSLLPPKCHARLRILQKAHSVGKSDDRAIGRDQGDGVAGSLGWWELPVRPWFRRRNSTKAISDSFFFPRR